MVLQGKGAASGAVVGGIYIYNEKFNIPAESLIPAGEEQSHFDRYVSIKKSALNELEEIKLSVQKIDPAKAAIFDAQKEIVEDIIINEEIPARIFNENWSGDWAIYQVYETVLNVLKKTVDPLIAERAADFDDVRALLLRLWYGQKTCGLSNIEKPVIIAARDLKPSDTASLDKDKVLAILTEQGSFTSHTAIIAKSFGIPAVLGIEGLLGFIKQGQLAAVDATEGKVILDPGEEIIKEFNKKSCVFYYDKLDAQTFQAAEGRTSCGEKIDICLNISSSNEDEIKAESFTDSVGLFRTEFLFMERNTLPDEEEQFTSYKKILECFGKKPVYIRTLDVGADKKITSVEVKREKNPFLGNRGIRFCFSNQEIFITQIRAALRASAYGNLWLMLPMIGSLEDVQKAKKIITHVKDSLVKEHIKTGEFKVGIMIEVPGIALIADLAAMEVDFASIGSNDLCQYLCAADRMNNIVEPYYHQYHPGIFRLIKETAAAFKVAGKPLSICGELGGDIYALPVLIGLGIRKFSMGAASVASVKRALASITVEKCEAMSQKVLGMSTAAEIKAYLTNNKLNNF
jgi:phosphotransferase system enzyme I (PtsI)